MRDHVTKPVPETIPNFKEVGRPAMELATELAIGSSSQQITQILVTLAAIRIEEM